MDEDARVMSDVVVALVTDGARLGLTLGAARGWAGSHGETLAPLALPSAPAPSGRDAGLALAVGGQSLGCPLEAAPGPWTYGPSPRHAMDRVVAGDGAPFLAYERFDAPEESGAAPRRVAVRIYRARTAGPCGGGACAVVWAPLPALRAALGGIWLAALLAMEDVTLAPAAGEPHSIEWESTLVYLPAATGERQLLRACAKYGDAILFATTQPQEAE